jgi:hypothetical protein
MLSDKEYMATGGNKCPKCLGDDIEGGSWDGSSEGTTQEVTCPDCGYVFCDFYVLKGYMNTDGTEPDGKLEESYLTETELTEVLEIARQALGLASVVDMIATESDLSEEYLIALLNKIELVTAESLT